MKAALLLLFPIAVFAATPADIASSALENLPKAPTEIHLQNQKQGQPPTAGDILELTVKPPIEDGKGAEPSMATQLKDGPVEWGGGRVLWWKASETNPGEITLGITTYKPGPFEIPSIPFSKDGKGIFVSEPESITYSSVGGDKSKDDIYPPETVTFPQWVWILLSLLALALVLSAIWWIARWHQKRRAKLEELSRAPRILSPIEKFEKVRTETDQKNLVDKEIFKPHYFALSDAAKRFLGEAYRFDAEERTTRELIRELEGLGLNVELITKWQAVFEEMDVTKFTDQTPLKDQARSLSSRLSDLVALTYRGSPAWREVQELAVAAARGNKA